MFSKNKLMWKKMKSFKQVLFRSSEDIQPRTTIDILQLRKKTIFQSDSPHVYISLPFYLQQWATWMAKKCLVRSWEWHYPNIRQWLCPEKDWTTSYSQKVSLDHLQREWMNDIIPQMSSFLGKDVCFLILVWATWSPTTELFYQFGCFVTKDSGSSDQCMHTFYCPTLLDHLFVVCFVLCLKAFKLSSLSEL